MQHCFHVVFLHNRDTIQCILGILEKIDLLQNLYLTVIFQIIIKCDAHAQNSKSLFIYISAVSESMLLKQTLKTSKEKYKE